MWIAILVGLLVIVSLFSALICLYCYGFLSEFKAKLAAYIEVIQAQNTLLCTLADESADNAKKIVVHSDNFKIANENFTALNTSLTAVRLDIAKLKKEGGAPDGDKTDMN